MVQWLPLLRCLYQKWCLVNILMGMGLSFQKLTDMNHQAPIHTDTRNPKTASGFHKGQDVAFPHQIAAAASKKKAVDRFFPQSFLEAVNRWAARAPASTPWPWVVWCDHHAGTYAHRNSGSCPEQSSPKSCHWAIPVYTQKTLPCLPLQKQQLQSPKPLSTNYFSEGWVFPASSDTAPWRFQWHHPWFGGCWPVWCSCHPPKPLGPKCQHTQ